MTIQELEEFQKFKLHLLLQGFQLLELGAKLPGTTDRIIEVRVMLIDQDDGLMFWRQIELGTWSYGTIAHQEQLRIAAEECAEAYLNRMNQNVHTCNHSNTTVLGVKRLCINCKAVLPDEYVHIETLCKN